MKINFENSNIQAFTINQLCELIGISRTLVYNEINRGNLKAVKMGRRTFILKGDLETYLASRPQVLEVQDA